LREVPNPELATEAEEVGIQVRLVVDPLSAGGFDQQGDVTKRFPEA
jgi:hypothetical protein